MTYVIHGATGAQGSPVVAALVAAGKSLTAISRNSEAAVDGARVVAADYSSTDQLTHAYQDAKAVFVHLPLAPEETRVTYARNIVAAVQAAQPARVVLSTSGMPPETPAASTLISGLADTGVSHAVIAPMLFFENLLLPPVVEGAREQGALRYPLPADFRVSWASHLDIADAAVALFERPDITGVVAVGQYPAITGADLAEAFGARLGRSVAYEAITPEDFGASIAPLLGEGAAAGVVETYKGIATLPALSITPDLSAQKLLDIVPRTPSQWLADVGL